MIGELVLEFPAPTVPLSINRANSMHWAARRKRLEPWREMAWAKTRDHLNRQARARAAREWRRTPIRPEPVPVNIQVELPFRTATRRDPHNYTGTVVKAVVDGLVLGGLIPDDTPEWATIIDPTITVRKDRTQPLVARVIITPRSTHGDPEPAQQGDRGRDQGPGAG